MSLTWAAGAMLVALCWSSGTLLTVIGRRRAAVLFAGDSPGFGPTVRAQLTGTTLNRVIPGNGGLVTTHLQLLRRHGVPSTALTATLLGYAASHVLAHLTVGSLVLLAMAGDLVPGARSRRCRRLGGGHCSSWRSFPCSPSRSHDGPSALDCATWSQHCA